MGQQFRVDIDDLRGFQKTLTRAHASLEDARGHLRYVDAGDLGSTELDAACHDFQEHWRWGAEEIARQTKKLADAVGKSADNYQEVETALEKAFAQAGKGGAP